MDKIKKFISAQMPVDICNLNCSYCYVKNYSPDLKNKRHSAKFTYDINLLRKAMSYERLGGACLINIVGDGETVIPEEILQITRILLESGHYVFITTNGTQTLRQKQFAEFPPELKRRLGFKFSYHYKELVRTGLLDTYYANLNMMRKCGCSVNIELVPGDDLIELIDDIKESIYNAVGSLCHVTLPRVGASSDKGLLSDFSLDDFVDKWSSFGSAQLQYKKTIQGVKVKEFCYAGAWSYILDLSNGNIKQCHKSNYNSNIFKNMEKPLPKFAIGNNCREAYCWCGHIYLPLGVVPELNAPTYDAMRNKVCNDGSEWLWPEMKQFMHQKLYDNNRKYSKLEKLMCNVLNKLLINLNRIKAKAKKILKR